MVGGTDGVGEDQIDLAPGDMPSSIANTERVRSLPNLLAACLVAFAVVGLGHRAVISRIGAVEHVTVPWTGIVSGARRWSRWRTWWRWCRSGELATTSSQRSSEVSEASSAQRSRIGNDPSGHRPGEAGLVEQIDLIGLRR